MSHHQLGTAPASIYLSTMASLRPLGSLTKNPGLAKLLALEAVSSRDAPGLAFDLAARKLDVHPDFDVSKAFVVDPAWLRYREIRRSLREGKEGWTHKAGKGHAARYCQELRNDLLDFASPKQWANVHSGLGPSLPKGAFSTKGLEPHLQSDAVRPKDAVLTAEFRGDPVPRLDVPSLSLLWLDFNIEYSYLARSYRLKAQTPSPNKDVLFQVLNNLTDALKIFHHTTMPKRNVSVLPVQKVRVFQVKHTLLSGDPVPLIFAVRGLFLYFVLEGGLQGKFVFQYAGNLLPDRHLSTTHAGGRSLVRKVILGGGKTPDLNPNVKVLKYARS